MFSGDAPRCTATMSVIRDRSRSKAGDLFAYFSDPYGFMRTIALSLADIAGERRAARRQRRSGAEHVARGGLYPLIRASDHGDHARRQRGDADGRHRRGRARQLRDVRRLRRGRPPLRDSRARRARGAAPPRPPARTPGASGRTVAAPVSPRGALRSRPDAGARRSASATARRSRRSCSGALAQGDVHAPAAVDEAWGDVGAVLADARQDPGVGGRAARARDAQPLGRGHGRARAQPRRARRARASRAERVGNGAGEREQEQNRRRRSPVLVSGCLGLDLPAAQQRATHARADRGSPSAAASERSRATPASGS